MEEDANQNPPVVALPPTTSPKDDDEIVGVGRTSGLHNVSNTCYLNATVQVRVSLSLSLSLSGKSFFFHFFLSLGGVQMDATRRVFSSSSSSLSLFSGGTSTRVRKTQKRARFIEKTLLKYHSLSFFLLLPATGVVRFGTVPSVFTERRMRTTVGGTPDARAKEKVPTTTTPTTSREAAEIGFIDDDDDEEE